jgi:hypothetical protein
VALISLKATKRCIQRVEPEKNPFVFVAAAVFGMWNECGQSCLDSWSEHLAYWMLSSGTEFCSGTTENILSELYSWKYLFHCRFCVHNCLNFY